MALSTSLRLPELPANISGVAYGIAGFVAAVVVLSKLSQRPRLDVIPTVDSSTWLGSWRTAFKYMTNAQSIIQEGYEKHESAPFRIQELYHRTVILSSPGCVEQLARAPDDVFSHIEAVDDQIQIRYLLGREIVDNPYHVEVVRSQLTRNLPLLYPEVRDEIIASFDEYLDLKGNEWKSVPALSTVEKLICRATNRVFVGLPLCRNAHWIDLNIRYTMDAIKGGIVVRLFPAFIRVLATRFLTNIPRNVARGVQLLGPMIKERQKYLNEYGREWEDKPNDLLSWLMEQADGPELTAERLTNRILAVVFASMLTSSNFFTQVLFYLASNPQYIQPLREEVEGIVENDGWSKVALGKMRKVDSFLKECQRIRGTNIVTVFRKAMKDFTFSDGTFIPKGTMVAVPARSVHHDGRIYENPEAFEPFRFADVPDEDVMRSKLQFASTTTEYLPWGHGKHACPGRFYVAAELKSMLAYVVVTYDVKLEENMTHPESRAMGTLLAADADAKIMFRNRVD